jgi:hypothetical protein
MKMKKNTLSKAAKYTLLLLMLFIPAIQDLHPYCSKWLVQICNLHLLNADL